MLIKKIKIEQMHIAEYHPRIKLQPDDKEYKVLEKSINAYGNVLPIVWNERTGNVVGGTQRLTILTNNGSIEADVVVVDLSLTEEKALNLALNKISGKWDKDKLRNVIDELQQEIDLTVTGFDEIEVENILTNIQLDLDSFFEDENMPESKANDKNVTCPKCGEVIEL